MGLSLRAVTVHRPLLSNLNRDAGMTAVRVRARLLLVTWPLVLRSRHPVLGSGGGEGEVLPAVCLRGDGVGLRSRWGGLLLETGKKKET